MTPGSGTGFTKNINAMHTSTEVTVTRGRPGEPITKPNDEGSMEKYLSISNFPTGNVSFVPLFGKRSDMVEKLLICREDTEVEKNTLSRTIQMPL